MQFLGQTGPFGQHGFELQFAFLARGDLEFELSGRSLTLSSNKSCACCSSTCACSRSRIKKFNTAFFFETVTVQIMTAEGPGLRRRIRPAAAGE